MKDQLNKVLKSIQQFWKAQAKKQKIIYLSVISGIVMIAIVLTLALNYTSYTDLFTGLEATEAAEILTEIQGMGIDAKVSSDGTISVPKEQENSLRMQLGTMGYPKSGFSYSIWTENINMFSTDSDKREIAKRELQERLQATIETLKGVSKAYVTLDIPVTSNTVISTTTSKTSASVVLHLTGSTSLDSEQIQGITRIVMMSVSGLNEENVSITDGTGRLLIANDESSSVGIQADIQRLQFKNDFESIIRAEILGMLSPAYGNNGVTVSVNAVINFDEKASENTTYDPSVDDHGMVEHQDTSQSSGSSGTKGEVVGVEPNADGTYPTTDTTDGDGSTWSDSSSSTSYLVNTLKEQTQKKGYTVDAVSVSVLVYREILADTEKATISNLVCKAALTPADLVSVENIPLLVDRGDTIPANADKEIFFGLTQNDLLLYGAILIAALLIIIIITAILLRSSKKKKKANKKQIAMARAAGASGQLDGYFNNQEHIEIAKISAQGPDTKEAAIRREIGDFAKSSPDIAAQLLKSWLREEGEN